MPRRCRDELLLAGKLELDRPAGLERRECQDILDEHFLLAAEAAAHALAKHTDLFRSQLENIDERTPRQERYLRGGTDMQNARRIDPGEAAMRLQCSVLDPLRGERSFIGDGGVRKRCCDIAVFAMGFRHDVAWAVGNAMRNRLVA